MRRNRIQGQICREIELNSALVQVKPIAKDFNFVSLLIQAMQVQTNSEGMAENDHELFDCKDESGLKGKMYEHDFVEEKKGLLLSQYSFRLTVVYIFQIDWSCGV